MKIAIVGSRSFKDYSALCKFIKETVDVREVSSIISGGAKGADSLGERFAKEHNITLSVFPAEWSKFGIGAGFIRNRLIVDEADVVFAFWDGKSSGTRNTIERTKVAGKKLYVYTFK